MATILRINSFQDLETREEEILAICREPGRHIIADCSGINITASSEIFEQLVYFVKVAAEHARRHQRSIPKLIVVPPNQSNTSIIDRLKQIRDSGDFEIELASSLENAKRALGGALKWKVLSFSEENNATEF